MYHRKVEIRSLLFLINSDLRNIVMTKDKKINEKVKKELTQKHIRVILYLVLRQA